MNVTVFGEEYKSNPVIPAKAGIHTTCHMALCYGFPPSRERQQWFITYTNT